VISSEKDSEVVGSYGTSSPMWKGGVRLNLGMFFIKGEYKQSLSIAKPEALSMLSVSAGLRF
jgi:hypothetical protein